MSAKGNLGLHGQPDGTADPQTLPPAEPTGLRAAAAGLSHSGAGRCKGIPQKKKKKKMERSNHLLLS